MLEAELAVLLEHIQPLSRTDVPVPALLDLCEEPRLDQRPPSYHACRQLHHSHRVTAPSPWSTVLRAPATLLEFVTVYMVQDSASYSTCLSIAKEQKADQGGLVHDVKHPCQSQGCGARIHALDEEEHTFPLFM
jgi:hypothetical protein